MTQETVERDHLGRYLLVPPEGGNPVAHTRVTTFASTLDNRYALEKWGERKVAVGLARRPDLLALVAAHQNDAQRLDSIVVDATEAAEASRGRNMGEALHALTEQYDRGDVQLAQIGEAWRADITAYAEAMVAAQLEVELIERTVVIPSFSVAGTLHRTVIRAGRRYILDVKTGQSLGLQTIAIQLALYAHAETIYDHDSKTHSVMPEVDKKVGIVMHVAAGSGVCECIAVDLETGWQGAQLASFVRGFRRAPVKVDLPAIPDRRSYLVNSVRRLVEQYPDAAAALAQQWPAGVATLRTNGHPPEHLELIAAVLHRIEGEYRIPFGDEPDPGSPLTAGQSTAEQSTAEESTA